MELHYNCHVICSVSLSLLAASGCKRKIIWNRRFTSSESWSYSHNGQANARLVFSVSVCVSINDSHRNARNYRIDLQTSETTSHFAMRITLFSSLPQSDFRFPSSPTPVVITEPFPDRTWSLWHMSKEMGPYKQWNVCLRRHPDNVTCRWFLPAD